VRADRHRFARAALVSVILLPCTEASAADPIGALEAADCAGVRGWAQDPDQPAVAIDVHVYFDGPPGDPAGSAVPIHADIPRDDLCAMLGSCDHGYRLELPLGVRDGANHAVWVYGIDLEAVNNPLLGGPVELECPAPPIVGGVRRWIAAPEVLTAWQFSTFVDLLHVDDATLATVPESVEWPAAPMLLTSMSGDGIVWMIDGTFRREVPSDALAAWRIDPATAVPTAEAELAAMPQGPDLRVRPFLVQGTMPQVYLLDEPPCDPAGCPEDETTGAGDAGTDEGAPTTDAGGDASGGDVEGSGDGGTGTGPSIDPTGEGGPQPSSGCGCSTAPSGSWWLWLLVTAARRPRSASTTAPPVRRAGRSSPRTSRRARP